MLQGVGRSIIEHLLYTVHCLYDQPNWVGLMSGMSSSIAICSSARAKIISRNEGLNGRFQE